jgi:hypothetical protein
MGEQGVQEWIKHGPLRNPCVVFPYQDCYPSSFCIKVRQVYLTDPADL